MLISIQKGFPEETGAKVITASITLHEVFGPYQQSTLLEDESVLLILPLLIFKPLVLFLKGDKKATCDARFITYAQKTDAVEPCLRFINEASCTDKIKWTAAVPKMLLHAFTKEDQENTLADLFNALEDPVASKTTYFYKETPCERDSPTHCIAIINEYGDKGNPHCITTTYLSIGMNK